MHICVLCHKGTEAILKLCLPKWREFSSSLSFVTPEDAPVSGFSDIPIVSLGESSRAGPDNIARGIAGIAECLNSNSNEMCVIEYDCVSISPFRIVDGHISGCFFPDFNNHSFRNRGFIHSPWVFNREIGERIFERARKLRGDELESGFPDRWFYHMVQTAGIPVHNLLAKKEAYSKDGYCPIWTPEQIVSFKESGAYIFHGFKTEEELKAILV